MNCKMAGAIEALELHKGCAFLVILSSESDAFVIGILS